MKFLGIVFVGCVLAGLILFIGTLSVVAACIVGGLAFVGVIVWISR